MVQVIILGVLLIGAIVYLGRMVYKSFTSSGCETGCGKCGTIDVDAMVSAAEKSSAR